MALSIMEIMTVMPFIRILTKTELHLACQCKTFYHIILNPNLEIDWDLFFYKNKTSVSLHLNYFLYFAPKSKKPMKNTNCFCYACTTCIMQRKRNYWRLTSNRKHKRIKERNFIYSTNCWHISCCHRQH